MRTRVHPSTRFSIGRIALLGLLQLLPVLAIAALASHDLSGAARAKPTTMGALEASAPATGLAAPTGLTVTIQRMGD